MKPLRPFSASLSLAAFAAVGFVFTRALGNAREYRALKKSDPSAAELYLDTAEMWGAAGLVALGIGGAAARLALSRDKSSATAIESRVEDPASRPE